MAKFKTISFKPLTDQIGQITPKNVKIAGCTQVYSVNSMQLTLQMLNRRVYTSVQCKLNAADVTNVK